MFTIIYDELKIIIRQSGHKLLSCMPTGPEHGYKHFITGKQSEIYKNYKFAFIPLFYFSLKKNEENTAQ